MIEAFIPLGLSVCVLLVGLVTALAEAPVAAKEPLRSGREVGENVPSFYTRAVTGPLMNRSVCYVCRNGSRPVVMVLMQQLDKETSPLLKQVDRLVDEHRAAGLRSFGVYVSEDPSRAISQVQTFSFEEKLALPLTVASSVVAEPHCLNLHKEAAVTVVLYHENRVVERFAYRSGELDKNVPKSVATAIEKMLAAGRLSE